MLLDILVRAFQRRLVGLAPEFGALFRNHIGIPGLGGLGNVSRPARCLGIGLVGVCHRNLG